MLDSYKWLLEKTRENQLKHSRGYAILDRMNDTLKVMKQKKKELIKPTTSKINSQQSNIAYFLAIIAEN